MSSGLPQLVITVNSCTAWCCDTYQLVFSRHLAACHFFFCFMEQVTVFLQSVKSLCQQPTLASIELPQTKLKNPLVLLMRYKKDPFSDTSGLSRSRVEEERRLQAQRKCVVPQTVSETSTLVTQVLSLLLKGKPGCVHEHLQHYIKPAHGLQTRSSACHGGGTGLCHTTRHLQVTVPVLHGTHTLPTALV